MEESVIEGLAALATAQQLAATAYTPAAGVTYDGVGNSFKQLAQLIKGGANVRVATIGMGGYDTHEDEGPRQGGYLFGRLNELARAPGRVLHRPGDRGRRRDGHGLRPSSAGGSPRTAAAPTTGMAAW